jgi:hypothetical protein
MMDLGHTVPVPVCFQGNFRSRMKIRDAPDIRSFLISGIRLDTGLHYQDIRPDIRSCLADPINYRYKVSIQIWQEKNLSQKLI